MKHSIAKEGIFNKQGLTPIESVEQTDVHEVLFYAMVEKLQRDEQINNMT